MVEVKGTVGGNAVSLHSLVEQGTANGARTNAVANVTPVTEMIVAQLSGALPEDSFKGFQGGALTAAQVAAARDAIVAALKAAGVDFSGIDPLKSGLVAATGSGQGNAYDQLLDALAARVNDDAFKVLVNQIAIAAEAKSDDGLDDAMEAVSGGSLAGCPVAVSGKYRTVDAFGVVSTRTLDFRNMKLGTVGSTSDSVALTADAANACVFAGAGTLDGKATNVQVTISTNGLGAFRSQASGDAVGTIGYIFPLQSHSYSALRGTWQVLETRVAVEPAHFPGQVTLGEEKAVTSCQYDSSWNCVADTATLAAVERSDGGIDVTSAGQAVATLYAYRAPNGSYVGIGNAKSATLDTTDVVVASRLDTLAVPAAGTKTRSWETGLTLAGTTATVPNQAPTAYTVKTSDAATSTVTRTRDSDGRLETVHYNQPLQGVRTRDAGTNFAKIIQVPLTGMGVVVSVNADPFGTNTSFIYNLSVVTP
jgi:hypothetical protein